LGQYLGLQETEMFIVPNLFVSWLHMTTKMFVLEHSLQRYMLSTNVVTNEVNRGQNITNFWLFPKSEVQI